MKKLASLLLCLCLVIPVLPARAAKLPTVDLLEDGGDWPLVSSEQSSVAVIMPPQTVVETPAWAAEAFQTLLDRGIAFQASAGSVRRGDFVSMLVRMLDKTIPKQQLDPFPPRTDAVDRFGNSLDWYITRAMGYGIAEGTLDSDGRRIFFDLDPLTREQAAKMACSLLDFVSEKLGYPLESTGESAVYADEDKISTWALPYTGRIAAYGLMRGDNYGNFDPQGELDFFSSTVLIYRILGMLDDATGGGSGLLPLRSELSLPGKDNSVQSWEKGLIEPWRSHRMEFYTLSNGDGTVSLLTEEDNVAGHTIVVERFGPDGSQISAKTIDRELPISGLGFGAFLDAGDRFYIAFGQKNMEEDDSKEVWRIVQYDRDWNRLAAASVSGGASYTTIPFFSTANTAMTLSEDGTLCLHTARQRYLTPDDGLRHQSNITITVDTSDMHVLSVSDKFPDNHVSHSLGQFARYDGETLVTVDRGDMYPRSFLLQSGGQDITLMEFTFRDDEIYQRTNSCGGGLEVSKDGYLFLGCSDPQGAEPGQPWNVFLSYTPRAGSQGQSSLTWLTQGDHFIYFSQLVKLDEDSFVALWQDGVDVHAQELDGRGQPTGPEQTMRNAYLPPADPVVMDGDICWIQNSPLPQVDGFVLYRLHP